MIVHLLFIGFALLGGLLLLWRSYLLFVHLPAAIWVSVISFKGWICPLTPLENHLRNTAGIEGYTGGFVEHYIIPIIYPASLTFNSQIVVGIVAVLINMGIYTFVFYKYRVKQDGEQK